MLRLKFAGLAAVLAAMPMAPAETPALAAAWQDGCTIVHNPDGSGSSECPSTATRPVPPPDPPPPPPRQCSSFPYRVLPAYPPQCAVTRSYIAVDGYPAYVLTCCS